MKLEMTEQDMAALDLRDLDRRIEALLDALELARRVRRYRLNVDRRAVLRAFAWGNPSLEYLADEMHPGWRDP